MKRSRKSISSSYRIRAVLFALAVTGVACAESTAQTAVTEGAVSSTSSIVEQEAAASNSSASATSEVEAYTAASVGGTDRALDPAFPPVSLLWDRTGSVEIIAEPCANLTLRVDPSLPDQATGVFTLLDRDLIDLRPCDNPNWQVIVDRLFLVETFAMAEGGKVEFSSADVELILTIEPR